VLRLLPSPIPHAAHRCERRRRLCSPFFGVRIGFRINRIKSVFCADAVDHEIESWRAMVKVETKPSRNILEFQYYIPDPVLLPGQQPCEYCMENSSKGLALCAARSHIVAVR
jgi:hypothetical protein